MKTIFETQAKQAIPDSNRINLTRAFVETGDERCPLAGIWSRLPEMDAAIDDEPGLTRPAWRSTPVWSAFRAGESFLCHLPFIDLQYGID